VAGTTRDVVEQAVQLGDIQLNLFDTAGLRETEDAIEAEGIRRSWKKLEEAGLIQRKNMYRIDYDMGEQMAFA